ncbi:glutamyl-tRNA(Gln) amidotransferase, A subunit [Denitrovibrio acetiphilus DSM 12809]|uniref:Glutamyl-tRNA(Gln) amidotransferase subunit A n=1 Tax=Denitrovibrio acetiphilus (strain DSM 12809 / NBRC 114555 / N2460) TaxID=522772 RepID=D4H3T6_DENA2|nr:Asp-tRNA(Asn)/Glu-tRNA(Gln) amidotransferase subunit GatA [Denitrovibrio acetiphilus]ADD69188.1 glutamyl-tRNA(Gln) amidotransferase, A subunit [Denitrovibrio acetiphilus DSM 12809]
MSFLNKNLKELTDGLAGKDFSSKELVQFYLDRIKKYDSEIQAFNYINENALKQAEAIDAKRLKGETLPAYAGVPVALKDLLITKDMPTTCSSKFLEGFKPPFNGTAVSLLEEAGFINLGKLSMDEFAMGSSNENAAFKKTRNPWDTTKVPGGSSGGSAASVAAGLAPVTLGSDTGGSIRQPASLCGVVGMKPTYGRVSRFGLVAFASSLDQIGPMGKSAFDLASILSVIGKHDSKDSTSANVDQKDYTKDLTDDVRGMKIGIPKEYFAEGLAPDVKSAVADAIKKYTDLGCEMVDISLPHTDYALATYYIIATAEASSNLGRYDGVRFGRRAEADNLRDMYFNSRTEGFGEEVKRRIMLGTYVLSAGYYDAYYLKAQRVRTLIKQDFVEAFKTVDAIICPTSPTTAFKAGAKTEDPLQMYLSDIYTLSLNLFGGCGLSLPCGFDKDGMPIGVQLMGNYFEEGKILNLAHAFELATDISRIPEKLKI